MNKKRYFELKEMYNDTPYFDRWNLYHFYKNPSKAKKSAWHEIMLIDSDAMIVSANGYYFTAIYTDLDGAFVVDTGTNKYKYDR